MDKFRKLKADEISARVGAIHKKGKGFTLLLYKNARVDMSILDETVGVENWQCEFSEVVGNLFCRVGIFIDNKWVWKSDCGTESNTEKEKGQASDSFKRACVKWGIGRELYTPIFIWIPSDKVPLIEDKNGKWGLKNKFIKFVVKNIDYNDKGNISKLTIVDEKGKELYNYGKFTPSSHVPKPEPMRRAVKDNSIDSEIIADIQSTQVEMGISNDKMTETLLIRYGVDDIRDLTIDQANDCLKRMRGAKNGL